MDHVRLAFRQYKSQFAALGFPRPYGRGRTRLLGRLNARAYPVALTLLWTIFLVAQVIRLYTLYFHPADIASTHGAGLEELMKAINELSAKVDTLIRERPPAR
jgi:hypothetical protein